MKKQVLVSVDRGETRVALLEATGTPAAPKKSGRGRGGAAVLDVLQQRHAGLPAVDADEHLLLHRGLLVPQRTDLARGRCAPLRVDRLQEAVG